MGRKRKRGGEPSVDGLTPFGGELYFAVDFTEGGAPIGLPAGELGEANARYVRDRGSAGARRAIGYALAAASPGSRVRVAELLEIGDGLSRRAWAADVEIQPDPSALSGDWVVLVPHADPEGAPDARVAWEVELLGGLQRRSLPFRVPRVVPPVGGLLVREWLAGTPLDLRAGRQPWLEPWAVVGGVAAAIHALGAPEIVDGFATRRAHALAALGALERLESPLAAEARSWALAHLPPDEPASLLHGDLLGQNLLIHLDLPPAVIDWEYASRGDPAYDLAIVTRGVRRPFHIERGLERLIEAYAAAGGGDVRAEHVRIHELSLLASWAFEESVARRGGDADSRFTRLARRVIEGPG